MNCLAAASIEPLPVVFARALLARNLGAQSLRILAGSDLETLDSMIFSRPFHEPIPFRDLEEPLYHEPPLFRDLMPNP